MGFDKNNELEKKVSTGVMKRETSTLHVALEAVLNRDIHGNVWSAEGFEASFWERYLAVFERLVIIARVKDVFETAPPHLTIPVEHISFYGLPAYRGLAQFLPVIFQLVYRLKDASARQGSFILRLPGAIGTLLGLSLVLRRRPFAIEMVGDPHDVLSGEGVSPVARLLRGPLTLLTRFLCRSSIASTYVTERILQQRYPVAEGCYTDGISSIDLPPAIFAETAKAYAGGRPFRLFFCGSLAQHYKGLDVLIEAVAMLAERVCKVTVGVAGDGKYRSELEALAKARGVGDAFRFLGHISRGEVFAAIDEADMFVMPSRAEGLPRAMMEAMARGAPCIGSRIGGIPELLEGEALVPTEDAKALADAVQHAMDNPAWMNEQATRNLLLARKYSAEALKPRRRAFYKEIKRRTGVMLP